MSYYRKRIDLTGKEFGNLTVIEFAGIDGHRQSVWTVRCKCGKQYNTGYSTLCYSRIKSCQRCADARRGPSPSGQYNIERFFHRYQQSAKLKGMEFELTREECHKLSQANCAYCGRAPKSVISECPTRTAAPLFYNGIDRINNSIGYTRDNVQTCCYICNRAKCTMAHEEFMKYLDDLVQYRSRMAIRADDSIHEIYDNC